MTKEQIKHALISILIGAVVSFLTVLFQGLLNVLTNLPPEIPGTLIGMARYLTKTIHLT
jgi:hypothetical protein